jgi:hypothetical protein
MKGNGRNGYTLRTDALARIRTGTPCGTAPSRQRVYQFHHQGGQGKLNPDPAPPQFHKRGDASEVGGRRDYAYAGLIIPRG